MADRLWKPIKLGNQDLKHRMIMAPLTRYRASDSHVPLPFVKTYYEQRASVPGTLLITEATPISAHAGGYKNVPGISSSEQVAAWKEVTAAVHAKGSYVFMQLWATGRVAMQEVFDDEGQGYKVISSSAKQVDEAHAVPQEMTEEDIKTFIADFAQAAVNAKEAGFDGVELHGANGYLIDQFWQDTVNERTDRWGGSIENRARFGLEVTKAVIKAVGDSRLVAMRLSAWSGFQGMRMVDPIPQFSYIVKELRKLDLAYLHLVESRDGNGSSATAIFDAKTGANDELVRLWGTEKPILLAGGFQAEKAKSVVNQEYPADNVCIVFGRYFISNPDLPFRIQHGIPLADYDRSTFYKAKVEEGYTDYPFSDAFAVQSGMVKAKEDRYTDHPYSEELRV